MPACNRESVQQLLEHSLQNLLHAETAYLDALRLMEMNAATHDLKAELKHLHAMAEAHLARMESASGLMESNGRSQPERAAEGFSEEIRRLKLRKLDPAVLDIGLAHLCRRIEARRACGYRSTMDLAAAAELYDVYELFRQGEAECLITDWRLSAIADVMLSGLYPVHKTEVEKTRPEVKKASGKAA